MTELRDFDLTSIVEPTVTDPTELPLLITIPASVGSPAHVPAGWIVHQVGRSGMAGDRAELVGLVCYDPMRHDLAIWLAGTAPMALTRCGWQQAFSFGSSAVWFRTRPEEECSAAALRAA